MAQESSEASRYSIAGLREFPADTSSGHPRQADRGNLPVVRGPSIRRAVASQVLAAPAHRAAGPDSVPGPDLADRALVDLADHAPAVPVRCHPRAKLLVRSVRQDARVEGISNIRRPKKAQ